MSVAVEPGAGRKIVTWAALVAGVVFAIVSVYSGSRAACALWVAGAAVLVLLAGFQLGRTRSAPGPR